MLLVVNCSGEPTVGPAMALKSTENMRAQKMPTTIAKNVYPSFATV